MATTSAGEPRSVLDAYQRLPDAKRRRRIREAAGIPQHVMADVLGVVPLTVGRWEQGVRPRAYVVKAYVDLLEQLAK